MPQSIQQLESLHPLFGVALWKKDINSVLIDVNEEYARLYGFKKPKNAVGKTDYDIPCDVVNLADYFRKNDKKIIIELKHAKSICILQVASGEWKALLVVKSPYFENNQVAGIASYSIELPKTYLQLGLIESNTHISQISYTITSYPLVLTIRESECLFLLMKGKSAKETARLLTISPRTVEQHLESIKNKFKCKTKLEVIAKAAENNCLNIIPESLLKKQLLVSLVEK